MHMFCFTVEVAYKEKLRKEGRRLEAARQGTGILAFLSLICWGRGLLLLGCIRNVSVNTQEGLAGLATCRHLCYLKNDRCFFLVPKAAS